MSRLAVNETTTSDPTTIATASAKQYRDLKQHLLHAEDLVYRVLETRREFFTAQGVRALFTSFEFNGPNFTGGDAYAALLFHRGFSADGATDERLPDADQAQLAMRALDVSAQLLANGHREVIVAVYDKDRSCEVSKCV